LFSLSRHVYVLDGDNIRHGLRADLGFSPKDGQKTFVALVKWPNSLPMRVICVTAFSLPTVRTATLCAKSSRDRFIEVFVNAPRRL
jgi:adenylylsulfate kinase